MENIFKELFDAAPDAVIVADHTGTIILANNQVGKVFGYDKEELIGKEVEFLVPTIQVRKHREYRKHFFQHPTTREMGKELELTARRKDGTSVDVEISLSPIHTHDSTLVAAAIRDVSERKHLLNELKKREELVTEQNQRLLNFAHIVSHNLRSHASNFASLLTLYDGAHDEKEREQLITHIKKISNSLSETIVHLNEVVSMQTAIKQQRKPVNLHEYILKTTEVLRSDILGHHAALTIRVPPDITITYNAAYLESILLNLISNSIKYRHPSRAPQIVIEAFYEGPHVVLRITDNGLGIDLQQHGQKLFGMYKTFHGNADARGIGLFITKNQVEAMGGTIEVQSEAGKGTTFTVQLT